MRRCVPILTHRFSAKANGKDATFKLKETFYLTTAERIKDVSAGYHNPNIDGCPVGDGYQMNTNDYLRILFALASFAMQVVIPRPILVSMGKQQTKSSHWLGWLGMVKRYCE